MESMLDNILPTNRRSSAWAPVRGVRWTILVSLFSLHIGAALALYPAMWTWQAIVAFVLLVVITQLFGISIGFHRLLSHRSFKTSAVMRALLATTGTLALQGGPTWWVAVHRLHHGHPDTDDDFHSPRAGFLWSHIGWMLVPRPTFASPEHFTKFAPDLQRDAIIPLLDRYSLLLQLALFAVLYQYGDLPAVLWGGCLRLVCVYHTTWLISSAAHRWGYKRYQINDDSRNLWWVALLTFGEGWHNNHHRMAFSARHGHVWWEVDIGWMALRAMRRLGLVWDVRTHEADA